MVGQSPAILRNAQAGRTFRSLVKFDGELPKVRNLTMREIGGREIVVRMEAAQTCYTSVDGVLDKDAPSDAGIPGLGIAVGHGGVGIVEAIGPQVIGTRIGDRVMVNLHASCGRCYNCVHGRTEKCVNLAHFAQEDLGPACATDDGRHVVSHVGGMGELLITNEEHVMPIFTDLAADELSMIPCVSGCGLGMTMTNAPVEVASDVVIFGGGPVGLSAVQGAKIKGASRIILVEPIKYRRELGLKLGATDVVDPNEFTDRKKIETAVGPFADYYEDDLITHLREMTSSPTDRSFAGGGRIGPNHVIEAVGGDRIVPDVHPQGPDPSGVTVLEQCWNLCSDAGSLATCSIGHPHGAEVKIPAEQWADGGKHHRPGTGGGTNDRRDVPKYIRLMETGQLDLKSLASKTYSLDEASEAYRVCGHREMIATIVAPNGSAG